MKEAYLRGYYGYKNFGDEILLFGVIEYLLETYKLEKLIVEVGNKHRINEWIQRNSIQRNKDPKSSFLSLESSFHKVHFVEIKQHRRKRLTHLANIFGCGKYKHMFKFFGGGEVLSDERPFPHDGRNIPLLFNYTVRKGNFILLGGIGSPKKPRTELLYKTILYKAQEIVLRDPTSLRIVEHKEFEVPHSKIKLHEDFSLSVLKKFSMSSLRKEGDPQGGGFIPHSVLVNINTATCTSDNIRKIQLFTQQYPDHKLIFFPCDMGDDAHCFDLIQECIPGIEYYDRTQHSLQETLELFSHTQAGIGSRLHFLLPLKFFHKPFQSIAKAEKVLKMITTP